MLLSIGQLGKVSCQAVDNSQATAAKVWIPTRQAREGYTDSPRAVWAKTYQYNRPGNHRASWGKAVSITPIISIGIMKGRAPRTTVTIPCLGTTLLRTNRLRPNGGVTNPISANTT